ncbi:PepSY domain-containing protein [Listeria costaricensis]|uniref:PepSY domain-containing protein n=1 Tax=Listeria costaricensis TaxID=2026604 RepID=UPI000C08A8E2|nr:PepSY domain-containing protein [Listeria costaricensis]
MKKNKKTLGLVLVLMVGAFALVGCSNDTDDYDDDNQTSQSSTTDSSSSDSSSTSNDYDLKTVDFDFTLENAIDQFTQAHSGASITSVSLEKEKGRFFYTVDGVDDNNEYEMAFDADTKETLQDKQETLDAEDKAEVQTEILNLDDLIPVKDAMEKATAQESGDVLSYDIDRFGDNTVYVVSIKKGFDDVEVGVNAQTGEIVGVDRD